MTLSLFSLNNHNYDFSIVKITLLVTMLLEILALVKGLVDLRLMISSSQVFILNFELELAEGY